jgi:prepilin-type processing-associated H-X9-DG protein
VVGGWADTPSLTTYASNAQVFGKCSTSTGTLLDWDGANVIPANFKDGTSNTIMFAERLGICGYYMDTTSYGPGSGGSVWNWWGYDSAQPAFAVSFTATSVGPSSLFQDNPFPFDTNCDVFRASTPHTSGGMQVGMADGHVRSIAAGMTGTTWWAACTPSSGDQLGSDW